MIRSTVRAAAHMAATAARLAPIEAVAASPVDGKTTFQVVSDLHIEMLAHYTPARPAALLTMEPGKSANLPVSADYLALCGDVGRMEDPRPLLDFLNVQARRFKGVFYVPGNHEYYAPKTHTPWYNLLDTIKENVCGNVHVMHNKAVDLPCGVRVVGSTLWSQVPEEERPLIKMGMNDYNHIYVHDPVDDLRNITVQETCVLHREAVDFLEANIHGDRCLVLTHHAPLLRSPATPICSPMYAGSPFHAAFATDLSDLICRKAPSAWAFGHTHWCCDFDHHGTRIISNALGYADECSDFDPSFTIAV